jgi:putative photosynthetic complex assembly protein
MTERVRGRTIPRPPLVMGLGLMLVTLAVTDFGGLIGGADAASQAAKPMVVRDLRFTDRPDGAIVVRDPLGDATVAVVEPGTNGFIRGTLRALSRSRRQADLDRDTPFRLSAYRDGRLTLEDLATGRQVALDAFGETNRDAFARLMAARATTHGAAP